MAENSNISWTHHTHNIVWGCIEYSPGCTNCYAKVLSKRYGYNLWGPAATTPRKVMSDAYWKKPLKWDRDAKRDGVRRRVFASSMADNFEDHPITASQRPRLFELIDNTPNLDWLLLTKRIENVMQMVPAEWVKGFPSNVWLGTSVENQEYADKRMPHLLTIPAVVRFVSAEPLIGPVDFSRWPGFEWLIIGGESGTYRREMEVQWARDIQQQCELLNVPLWFKQHSGLKPGANPYLDGIEYHQLPKVAYYS